MVSGRPKSVRVAAGAAAVALALGLPTLIVASAVVGDRWRSLVSTLIVVFVAVPVVAWFVTRRRPVTDPEEEPGGG